MEKKIIPPVILQPSRLRERKKKQQNKIIPRENLTCPLAHPTYSHPHDFICKSGGNTKSPCFSCGDQQNPRIRNSTFYYHCKTCDLDFHSWCLKYPRMVTHPYHLQHPLGLTAFDISRSQSVYVCTWCGKDIQGNWFYSCSICNFCLDFSCSKNVPLLIISNPKSHHHSLNFYPRPLLTPCDACGFVNESEPSYACFQCNYMVHQSCIDLPRIIKITRHSHRLIHTPYLQLVTSLCRICYKTVDGKYGQYSCCNRKDCNYVVHSKCATHKSIWDGKELEWEPEESNENEDIFPFKKIGHGLIKHFSHKHRLKLEKYDGVRDAEKQCEACVLPINSDDDFYNCMKCDFFLHEVCAGLLRKLDHALHVHTLVLDPSHEGSNVEGVPRMPGCSICSRKFSGFRYKCSKEGCVMPKGFQIDVRCVLVPDYFTHKCHEHPLFISTYYKGENKIWCKGCKKICQQCYIQCTICEFAICYQCTTIPSEVSYKYDKHPLSLCYGERTDGMYWCEVCEKEINPKDWFYTCSECCVTIHLQCVFGSSVYMKPDFTFTYCSPGYKYLPMPSKVKVFRNSNSTRPLCANCGHHCPSSVYYKSPSYYTSDSFTIVSCSLSCLEKT